MAASFPTSIKTFTTLTGADQILSSHQNEVRDEVTAVETALLTVVSFTPVIGGSGGTSGQAYSLQVGRGVKTGREVTVHLTVQLSTKGTITGDVQIQGLPYTSLNVSESYAVSPVVFANLNTNWAHVIAYVQPNSTVAKVVGLTAAAATNNTALATGDITNTTLFIMSFRYITAS